MKFQLKNLVLDSHLVQSISRHPNGLEVVWKEDNFNYNNDPNPHVEIVRGADFSDVVHATDLWELEGQLKSVFVESGFKFGNALFKSADSQPVVEK